MSKEISASFVSDFEAYADSFMGKHRVPGAVVALASADEIIYCKAFGYRDLAGSVAAGPNTIFGIASVTKSFTAMAVSKLVEEGKLSFDDPVSAHLPGFRLPGGQKSQATVRHLLTHTSGLPALDALGLSFKNHTGPDPGELEEPIDPLPPINTYRELVDYIGAHGAQSLGPPGSRFNYSNEGFALLGALVRQVSGMPFAAFVRNHLFEPLGMTRTTFSFEEMYEHDDVTVLYSSQGSGPLKASKRWPCAPAFQAAGRIKSTALDLIRFFQMYLGLGSFQGRRVMKEESIMQALTPHFKHALFESYGHAIHIRPDYHGLTLASHGGAGKGISAHAGIVPERGLAALVLTNLGGVPVGLLWGALINVALGLPADSPRFAYDLSDWPAHLLDLYSGDYASTEGKSFSLVGRGPDLLLQEKQKESVVKRAAPNVGVYDDRGQCQEMRFFVDKDTGRVRGVQRGVRFIPRKD